MPTFAFRDSRRFEIGLALRDPLQQGVVQSVIEEIVKLGMWRHRPGGHRPSVSCAFRGTNRPDARSANEHQMKARWADLGLGRTEAFRGRVHIRIRSKSLD
jgi:hypothetical protein